MATQKCVCPECRIGFDMTPTASGLAACPVCDARWVVSSAPTAPGAATRAAAASRGPAGIVLALALLGMAAGLGAGMVLFSAQPHKPGDTAPISIATQPHEAVGTAPITVATQRHTPIETAPVVAVSTPTAPTNKDQLPTSVARKELTEIVGPPPPGAAPVNENAYILAVRPTRKVTANFALRFNEPNIDVDRWLLVVASPPELVGQKQASVVTTPPGEMVTELSPERRSVIRVSIPGQGQAKHSVLLRVQYQAVLYERQLLLRQPGDVDSGPPGLEPAERAYYLRNTKSLDYRSPAFAKWLDRTGLRRAKGESEIAFARRAFQKIVEHELAYSLGNSSASAVVQRGSGDCVAFSLVYVSVLRASGVPARTLVGRWAESAKSADKIEGEPWYQTHCTTEFFAPRVGWVPVDPSAGVFGKADGDFLTFHVDPDLEVPTGVPGGAPMLFSALQPAGYCVYTSGKFEDALTTDEKWDVDCEAVAGDPDDSGEEDDGYFWWRHRRHKCAALIVTGKKLKHK